MQNKLLITAIIGPPNAGKSTLLNQLVNQKIAIVTSKRQTTRFNTKGVVNLDDTQIVFIDTPGLFSPTRTLETSIIKQARVGLEQAEVICFIVDAMRYSKRDIEIALKYFKSKSKPTVLLINKVDLLKDKTKLLTIAQEMNQMHQFDATFMISAKNNKGIVDFLKYLKTRANESNWLFKDDTASDITDRKLAEEITREHLYYGLGSELPYSLEVQTELWEDKDDGSVKICQVIHVLKTSQKKIVLGNNGAKLKSIGFGSRQQLSKILERNVHLFLYVRVRSDWIEKAALRGSVGSDY